jgi:hypothetical protein
VAITSRLHFLSWLLATSCGLALASDNVEELEKNLAEMKK